MKSTQKSYVMAYGIQTLCSEGDTLEFIEVFKNKSGYLLIYKGNRLRTGRLTSLAAVDKITQAMFKILKL
jgi:hypothetical protein